MSGGHSKTKTENRPLNAEERAALYNSQLGLIGSSLGNYNPVRGGGYASTGPSSYGAGGSFGGDALDSEGWREGFNEGQRQDPFGVQLTANGNQVSSNLATGAISGIEKRLFGKPVVAGQGLNKANPNFSMFALNPPQYDSPGYAEAGNPWTISGGDYDRLEQSIIDSRWAPLQRYESQVRQQTDEDLNKRGIYSSGVATQAQGDVTEQFLPQYTASGAEAATQRYGLQSAEQAMLNQLAADDAAKRNVFNLEQANRNYASAWAPYEYLAQLYNQTGGQVGATNQYQQNFGF